MIKVLFVCLGNICRSPMAEFMLKDKVKKLGIEDKFYIESAGISDEEEGNFVYMPAKKKLSEYGITCEGKRARQINVNDYDKFDYIIGMEKVNILNLERLFKTNNKIYRLLDFSDNPRDISDPWYTRNFDVCYCDLEEGIDSFLKYLGY